MAAKAADYYIITTQTCNIMMHYMFHLDIRYHTAAESDITPLLKGLHLMC